MKKRIPRTRKQPRRPTASDHTVQGIPEIRRSFELIEAFMQGLSSSTDSTAEKVAALKEKWMEVFGRELPVKMATDYVASYAAAHAATSSRLTRKRTQRTRGGMAPIDSTMRPGGYTTPGGMCSTYGDYLSKGFGFVTPSIASGVPPQRMNGGRRPYRKPRVQPRRGSKKGQQTGGMGLFETIGSYLSAAAARPSESTQPPSVAQDMRAMMNGQRVGMSPDPVQQPVPYRIR